jgi:hypothetical protein
MNENKKKALAKKNENPSMVESEIVVVTMIRIFYFVAPMI